MFGRLRGRGRRLALAVAMAMAAPLLSVQPASAAGYTFKPLKCSSLPGDYSYDAEITRSGYSMLVAGDDYVAKFDVTKNPAKLLGTSTAAWGQDLAIHSNRVVAYVASRSSDTLFVLDIAGNKPKVVRTIPVLGVTAVATSNDGKYLYVVSDPFVERPYFRVYSTAKPTAPVRLASLANTYGIDDVAVAPNGKSAVFTNTDRATLVRLADPRNPTVVKHIPVPYYVSAVTYTRDSNSVYVGASYEAKFSRIDVGTRRVVSTRTIGQVGDAITDLEPSSDNRLLWVTTDSGDWENSAYAFGIKSGSVHFLGNGIYGPQAAAVSSAGPSKGRVYFPSSIDEMVCGVKQTPN